MALDRSPMSMYLEDSLLIITYECRNGVNCKEASGPEASMAASSDSKQLLEIHKITVCADRFRRHPMADWHPDKLLHGDLYWASTAVYSAIVQFSILQLGVVALRQCMNNLFLTSQSILEMLLVPSCVFPALDQFKCFVLSGTCFYIPTQLTHTNP